MVKRTQLTVFGAKVTGRSLPPAGSAPTAMLVPSLNESVPASTFSPASGRPCRFTCDDRHRRRPVELDPGAAELARAHPLPRRVVVRAVDDAVDRPQPALATLSEEAVTCALSARLAPKSVTQKNSSLRANESRWGSPAR